MDPSMILAMLGGKEGGGGGPKPLSILGNALSLGIQAYALKKSAKENKAYEKKIQDQQGKLKSWYDKEYNRQYLGTQEASSGIRNVLTHLNRQGNRLSNTAAQTGMSDEAQVANRTRANETYSGFVNTLVGRGDQRKQGIHSMYTGQNNLLEGKKDNIHAQKQQNWMNLMNNAANMAKSIGDTTSGGGPAGSAAPGMTDAYKKGVEDQIMQYGR